MANAAPPPDPITGWRGSVPFLTARGRYATPPRDCRMGGGRLAEPQRSFLAWTRNGKDYSFSGNRSPHNY